MSNLQNDELKDRLVEAFNEWFDFTREEFYSEWSQGSSKAYAAWSDGDDRYFDSRIDELYQSIEEEFFNRDQSYFDIQELYESVYGEDSISKHF